MSDPILATADLVKHFGALKASDAVSIDLRPGEIHAIIGPNGAGKSTLIQQISGALRPDSGQIYLRGQDVTRAGTAARARAGLGRTFQISNLCMEDSVLENAVLGIIGAQGAAWRFWRGALTTAEITERAEAVLERVGLEDARHTRCAALSHGERRQLEVGMALALSPHAFLMDEPMAGMGAGGTKRLTGLLDGLRTEAPILLVEHDMDAVFALADRISVLVYGKVIATGTAEEIRTSAEVREAYLGDGA